MTDLESQRRYIAQVDAMRADFLRATGRPDPFAERVKGALFAMVAPRLALDAQMPDLNEALQGTDRSNFRSRRKHIGDAVRRAVRGRLGRDADLSDIEEMLAALEQEEEQGEDRYRARGRDEELSRPGMSPALDPEAHDFFDELEEMRERGEIGEDAYRRLRTAKDRRAGRDAEPSPYENFDARRRGLGSDDPPDFMGMPRTGGSMVPMPSSVDRPGFGEPRDVAARDRRPGFRRYGADSVPTGFADRFGFTRNATTGRPSMPGIKAGCA
jgi:hypothetical protein